MSSSSMHIPTGAPGPCPRASTSANTAANTDECIDNHWGTLGWQRWGTPSASTPERHRYPQGDRVQVWAVEVDESFMPHCRTGCPAVRTHDCNVSAPVCRGAQQTVEHLEPVDMMRECANLLIMLVGRDGLVQGKGASNSLHPLQ